MTGFLSCNQLSVAKEEILLLGHVAFMYSVGGGFICRVWGIL